jgi:uncharacterized membrane protein
VEIMMANVPELAALLIGVVAGLRMWTAPAAVSWAAKAGALDLRGSRLAFLGDRRAPWLLSGQVLVETVYDQWPGMPSRKSPIQLAGRLMSGAMCGAAVAGTSVGIVAGAVGALIGTFGGYSARMKCARAFRRDRPAAVLEDLLAIAAGAFAVSRGSRRSAAR